MAGTIHQAMAYLGLAADQNEEANYKQERSSRYSQEEFSQYDEDFYDDYEQLDTQELSESNVAAQRADIVAAQESKPSTDNTVSTPFVRAERKVPDAPVEPVSQTNEQASAPTKIKQPASTPNTNYESEDQLRQITTIHPRSYNDAKIIGESFRENIPVIMNVTDMGEAEAKRLVDFSAGLAFALHGSIERVTDKVFLLTPTNLEVLAPEGAEMPVALDADASSLFNQG